MTWLDLNLTERLIAARLSLRMPSETELAISTITNRAAERVSGRDKIC